MSFSFNGFLLGLMINLLMITETNLKPLGLEGWLEKEEDLFEKEYPLIYEGFGFVLDTAKSSMDCTLPFRATRPRDLKVKV